MRSGASDDADGCRRSPISIVTPEGKIVSGVALATYMITNIRDRAGHSSCRTRYITENPSDPETNSTTEETSKELLRKGGGNFLGQDGLQKLNSSRRFPKAHPAKSLFSVSRVAKKYFSHAIVA